jgi:hypothetical protein
MSCFQEERKNCIKKKQRSQNTPDQMAAGFQPVVAVQSATGARGERKLRLVAAVSVSLALLVATVAVQRSTGAVSLGEGTDEKMKGWEDGMFPPHATFPAGYHFGNDNG